MQNKTQGVLELVEEVLKSLPRQYGEDVIEDVCLAIENNPARLRRYDWLIRDLTRDVVNQWIGNYTKQIINYENVLEVDAKRSKLITSYSKLRPKTNRKK